MSAIHYIIFEKLASDKKLFRRIQIEEDNPLLILELAFVPPELGNKVAAVKRAIPLKPLKEEVKLVRLMFHSRTGQESLLRVYNMNPSTPVTVDLKDLLENNYGIPLKGLQKMKLDFNGEGEANTATTVILGPMAMQAFSIKS